MDVLSCLGVGEQPGLRTSGKCRVEKLRKRGFTGIGEDYCAQLGIFQHSAFWRLCRARHKRHCFGTHLIEAGAPIHAVKELMGHRQIETTMIYLHLTHRIERDCRDLIQTLCQGLPR